ACLIASSSLLVCRGPREDLTLASAGNAPSCGARREAPRREERLCRRRLVARVRLALSHADRAAEAGEVTGARLVHAHRDPKRPAPTAELRVEDRRRGAVQPDARDRPPAPVWE